MRPASMITSTWLQQIQQCVAKQRQATLTPGLETLGTQPWKNHSVGSSFPFRDWDNSHLRKTDRQVQQNSERFAGDYLVARQHVQ
jgi:hypothetical protein